MVEPAEALTLVSTDIVDSTQLNQRLGDGAMAQIWAQHDALEAAE